MENMETMETVETAENNILIYMIENHELALAIGTAGFGLSMAIGIIVESILKTVGK